MQIANFISMALNKRSSNACHNKNRIVSRLWFWRVLQVLTLLPLFSGAYAQSPAPTEYQVKAAFLYNFAKFVEWPASSFSSETSPLQICVFGHDPFSQALHDITQNKSVGGRKLEVKSAPDIQQAKSCQVLFISASEETQVKQILEGLRATSVLTVGDTNGFIEQGGMINFVLENDRVRFEINRKAAEQAGLKISSKLLSVAKSVTL
jgi:YfiR/HmsC-like